MRNSLMLINDRVCCTKSKINTALWINNTNQSQVLLSHKDGLQSILRVPSRGSPDYKVRPSSCRARRVSFSGDTAVLNDCVTSTTTTDSSCRSTDHSSKKKRQVSFLSREEKEKENVKNTQNVKTKAKERESGGGIAVNRAPSRNISGSEQRRPARMVKKVLATSNTPERPTPRYRLRSIGCRNEAVQEERSDFVGSRVLCSQGTYKGYGGKVQVDHGQTVTVEFDGVMGPRRIIKTCLKSPVGERKWQSSAAW